MRVGYYIKLWLSFLRINYIKALSFRLHFFMILLESLIFYASQFVTIQVLFNHIEQINHWDKTQYLFYWSFVILVMEHFYCFVVANLWIFGDEDIKRGQLDFKLLKPASGLFSAFFNRISIGYFSTLMIPWIIVYYFAVQLNLDLLQMLMIPFLLVFTFCFLTLLNIAVILLAFWTKQGYGLNYIRFQVLQFIFWPDFVFQRRFRYFFLFIIPVLIIGSAPVRFMLDLKDWNLLAVMLGLLIIMSVFVNWLWNKGVQHYDSASS